MRGSLAKEFRRFAKSKAKADGHDLWKPIYRNMKGRLQRPNKLGYQVPEPNLMEVNTGKFDEHGKPIKFNMPRWGYLPLAATTYNQRQPRRYQDRSKY